MLEEFLKILEIHAESDRYEKENIKEHSMHSVSPICFEFPTATIHHTLVAYGIISHENLYNLMHCISLLIMK